ncbi:MAG: hypothetical protein NZ561_11000 [Phycisphaerae bacterium]|nr:hypothetical protein [Phycisphaerae bacterium]MDW8262912.1 hypothetical protein [Phycisphaerales bacterium]
MTPQERTRIRHFLMLAVNTERPLEQILSDCGLTPPDFFRLAQLPLVQRWMRRITRSSAAALRELELARGALSAAEQMSARIAGRHDPDEPDLKESIRRLWVDAIRLARAQEQSESRTRPGAAPAEPTSTARDDPTDRLANAIAPELPDDEAATIVARMLRRRNHSTDPPTA